MTADDTYPATVGQLSVWRDLESFPPERRWEANNPYTWSVPSGRSVADVWDALGALAMRHESLRTTYLIDDTGNLRQRVVAHDPATAMASARHGVAPASEGPALEERELQRAFDTTRELPWRAWVLCDGDEPTGVLVIVHHIAADGFAALLLERDFDAIISGETLAPVTCSPVRMAISQQGSGSSRLRTAERYWRRTMESAPRKPSWTEQPERVGATMHTGIPMPVAHEAAATLEVSLASLILAGYYRGLRAATGRTQVLLFPISNNRFDPDIADVVTSLVQWVPLVLDFEPSEPVEEMAKRIHWKSFNALKYGICDPDAIVVIRDEAEHAQPPVDPGFYYNPILAPPGFPSQDTLAPPSVEWYEPARAGGPGVYLIVRGLTSIDLIVRANRPEFGKEAVSAVLTSVSDAVLCTAGIS